MHFLCIRCLQSLLCTAICWKVGWMPYSLTHMYVMHLLLEVQYSYSLLKFGF